MFDKILFQDYLSRYSKITLPHPRNNGIAEFTFITDYVVSGNIIALALNQQFFAVVAISIIPFMVRYVTEIDITDSFSHS